MKLLLLALPIFVCLILSFKLLIFPKKKSKSSRLLGLFFLFFCISLFAILFQYLQVFYPVIQSYFYIIEAIFYATMLSLPIVVFFYIISLTDYFKDYKTFGKVLPHLFIPLQSLLFSLYLFIDNNEANYKATEYFNFFSLKAIFILLNIYYLTNAIIKYKKHRLKIDHILSYDKGISFKWIAVFIIGYILFILCFFILNPDSSPYVVYLPLVLVLTYLFFQRNKQITVDLSNKEEETESSNNVDKKPNTFNKNNEELKNKLLNIMISTKPHLTSDLTVYELAKILNSNSKYLSVIINKDFNQNFATFINSYRIEEAKALLKDEVNNQYTIEAIGKMSGFNSKSAFNKAFKQSQNITPSQFKNTHI